MKNLSVLILLLSFFFSSCTKTNSTSCKSTAIPSCICTQEYDPVCGCDNITYGNDCMAKCEGLTSWTKGKCP